MEQKIHFKRLVAALVFFFNISTKTSPANSQMHHVHLPNLYVADEFGQRLLDQYSHEIQNNEDLLIDVVHYGEIADMPHELTWLVDHLKRLETVNPSTQVEVTLYLVDESEFKQLFKEAPHGEAYHIEYKPPDAGTEIEKVAEVIEPSILKKLEVIWRNFYGIPNGISWVMYKLSFTDRTVKEHAVELSSAVVQAAGLYLINYSILSEQLAAQPELLLHPERAALVAASWKLLTGYIERANNAFFAQGNNWGPIHEFSMNRKFALSGAYVHSIIIGVTVQLGAHGFDGLTSAILAHTAWNSFLGLFAKAEPLILISKHQTKKAEVDDSESLHHSKWLTIVLNFAFAMTYQAIKAVHFYEFEFLNISTVFVVLGLGGLSYEIIKFVREGRNQVATKDGHITRFTYKWMRFKNRVSSLSRKKSERACQTLLTIHHKPHKD